VGIDPDEHLHEAPALSVVDPQGGREAGIAVTSRAVPSRATPRHGGPAGEQTGEPHRSRWWAAAWRASRRAPKAESGLTSVLKKSSNSRRTGVGI
jgi:hypothetical protein